VRSFGVRAEPVELPGGEGLTFQAGHIVLKRAHEIAETVWIQDLLARVEPDRFRVATPVPATGGQWISCASHTDDQAGLRSIQVIER
jgi:hypothetical protein